MQYSVKATGIMFDEILLRFAKRRFGQSHTNGFVWHEKLALGYLLWFQPGALLRLPLFGRMIQFEKSWAPFETHRLRLEHSEPIDLGSPNFLLGSCHTKKRKKLFNWPPRI